MTAIKRGDKLEYMRQKFARFEALRNQLIYPKKNLEEQRFVKDNYSRREESLESRFQDLIVK